MAWLREIFNDGVPGDADRVLSLCDTALEAIGAGDSSLALNLLLGAALRCWWADTGPVARARVAEVAHLVEGGADDPRYAAVLGVGDPVLQGQEVAGILDAVVLESVADPMALWMLGMAAHAIQAPVHAADFLGRAETKLRQQGMLGLLVQVLIMQVLDHLELGDWDRAASCAEEAKRLAGETGQPGWDIGSRLLLPGMIVALRGDSERAEQMAAEVEQAVGASRLNDGLCCVQLIRGWGLISAGRYADAYTALSRLFDPADPAFHMSDRYHGVMFLAEAAVHAGRVKDARLVVAKLEAEAITTPAPTLHRQLSYARAVLADDNEAETLFAEALRADLTRWPWLRARAELAYGQWLRRQRRVAESRSPLRAAQITFDLIGARSWGDQARSELRAAGERIQPQGPSAQDVLSAQELQIARLAAEGLSNREIGERLYLSPRTVGSHLYRIFPKLDITSRAQLAARLSLPEPRER
jgi:DNA-binding CsgD family transcriptional regulator